MTGWVAIAGLGPGNDALVTPEVQETIEASTDVVGYYPYVDRIVDRPGLTKHGSDNRVELDRAGLALQLAHAGARVTIVSSGDPGVFAMASAVFERLENGPKNWQELEIRVLPGITAMLAAAARLGAPLGHDFAAINLSDNLKPWTLIETRIRLAARAGFALAFYNPRSRARTHQFGSALDILRSELGGNTLISFAKDVSKPTESISTVPLNKATSEMADMRTIVIVGTQHTRWVGRYVYTPRSAP